MVIIHPHALKRIEERGSSESEVIETVLYGEKIEGKFGRTGFRKIFNYKDFWNKKYYKNKIIEAFCVFENGDWLVITIIVKFDKGVQNDINL
jgi:hypothetical protein